MRLTGCMVRVDRRAGPARVSLLSSRYRIITLTDATSSSMCASSQEAKERGNEAFKTGDFPKAIAEYSEAIKRQPDNAKYWTNRAVAKAKLMDFGG